MTDTTQNRHDTPPTWGRGIAFAGHAIAGFVALSIGAALRHYITGATPESAHFLALTLWGWPAGVPLYAAAAYLMRPLP